MCSIQTLCNISVLHSPSHTLKPFISKSSEILLNTAAEHLKEPRREKRAIYLQMSESINKQVDWLCAHYFNNNYLQ